MKTCNKCKIPKELTEFHKNKASKDGYRYSCKDCKAKIAKKARRTKQGVITTIYGHQQGHSITRGHKPPTYTNKQLQDWLQNDKKFGQIYDKWVESGYTKSMKPSVDRLDDSKGYSFDNIQLTTWGENKAKGHRDMRKGKIKHGHNPQKAVIQVDSEGLVVGEFVSACEAQRQTGIHQSNISACCLGKLNTTGGFVWKFKDVL